MCLCRKVENDKSVDEFYHRNSSVNYFSGIKVPMVFLNSLDDPIVPAPLLEIIKDATAKHNNFLYVEQKYGGHLGFYEGGYIYPNAATWLDKAIVNLSDSLAIHVADRMEKAAAWEDDICHDKEMTPVNDDGSGGSSLLIAHKREGSKRPRRPKFVCRRGGGSGLRRSLNQPAKAGLAM